MLIPPHWLYTRFGRDQLPPAGYPSSPLVGWLVWGMMLMIVIGQIVLLLWG